VLFFLDLFGVQKVLETIKYEKIRFLPPRTKYQYKGIFVENPINHQKTGK
jgi:hypothetical protein